MSVRSGELCDARSGRVLFGRLTAADSLLVRTVGYMGRRNISDDEALWFDRTAAIHTLGMLAAIDVVFLDAESTVVKIEAGVKPWHPWIAHRGARSVLELAAGGAERAGIVVQTKLEMRWGSPR